jgi:DNA repair exonuclease SbcCD ATPase subunit
MSKALIEFKNFLKATKAQLTEYEKKLSKIILDNFLEIEAVGSHGGRRGRLIADLVTKFGDSMQDELVLDEIDTQAVEGQFVRLSKLIVKNFRGFSDEYTLEFKNPYTFVYGPNGTGKSSLCEALEYSLLGTIHEAEVKRIDLASYIKNANTGKVDHPVLIGIDTNGNENEIEPRPHENEFCFIERARIDGFSRVSANTPQAQQQRLAALFGLEDFNTFVTNFNEHFDNYLDCMGKKAEQLSQKEKEITAYNKFLESIPKKREEIETQVGLLLVKFPETKTIEELKEKISGNEEKQGVIQKNNEEIAKLGTLKHKQDPGIDKVLDCTYQLDSLIKEHTGAQESLKNYKEELSLKDLYVAILRNKDKFKERCPACESELYREGELVVPVDPFSNAKKKVEEFEKAIKLENRVSEIDKQIQTSLTFLETRFPQMTTLAESINFPEKDVVDALNQQFLKDKLNEQRLSDAIATIIYHKDVFSSLKEHFTEYNKKANETEGHIKDLEAENQEFDGILDQISTINATIKSINEHEQAAIQALIKFKQVNKELIEQVEQEKSIIDRNNQYNEAYVSLKMCLENYNRQLPSALAANLNTKALEFYNAINRYDHPSDLLEGLKLPENAGNKIKIRFKEGQELDALHVLSEGHIRCLGLSILLAKNVQENLPIVIFDDVVNAIDDEHRRGIVETILEHQDIRDKQLIITTHGEEFVKQLENNISIKEYSKKVTRIDFLEPTEPKKISIKLDLTRNYLIVAQQRLQEGQVRDSLANGRRAFESLLNILWKRIAKRYNVQLTVAMRLPGRPPELMSIAQSLRSFITKNEIETYYTVVSLLEKMLGNDKKYSVEWNYLNKGTHDEEREEEFDKTVVRDILAVLEEIDNIIMGK